MQEGRGPQGSRKGRAMTWGAGRRGKRKEGDQGGPGGTRTHGRGEVKKGREIKGEREKEKGTKRFKRRKMRG